MVEIPTNLAQQYFDSADVIMIAVSSDEIITDINKKGCILLEYSKDEILGKNMFNDFVPKKMRENARRFFHEMLTGHLRHVHSEYPVSKKSGQEVIINWHNILVSDEKGIVIGALGSGTDVTEQRQAEEATMKMENRLQATLDSMLEGCQIIDFDWRYAYVNEAIARQGRRAKKELLGHTMMEMYPGIENTELFSCLKDCMIKRIPHQMENEFIFPDGSKGWFELRIEPAPEGILILSHDVTKRKELEEELNKYRHRLEEVVTARTAECAKVNEQLTEEIEEQRRKEEGLRLRAIILDNAREAIFLVNSNGNFVYANEAAAKTYGYSRDEFLNLNLRRLLRPEEAHLFESRLRKVLEEGQLELETVHVRKDGSELTVKVHHSLVKTLHGEFIVSVMQELAGNSEGKTQAN